VDGDQCPSQIERHQLGKQVSDPIANGAPDMQPCSQLVDEQEASARNCSIEQLLTVAGLGLGFG